MGSTLQNTQCSQVVGFNQDRQSIPTSFVFVCHDFSLLSNIWSEHVFRAMRLTVKSFALSSSCFGVFLKFTTWIVENWHSLLEKTEPTEWEGTFSETPKFLLPSWERHRIKIDKETNYPDFASITCSTVLMLQDITAAQLGFLKIFLEFQPYRTQCILCFALPLPSLLRSKRVPLGKVYLLFSFLGTT